MKILYALANHPQLSEMYVESELNFVEQSGVEVAVWGARPPGAPYEVSRKVYSGKLADAEGDFKPDFVHFHWMTFAESHLAEVKSPITVRGHSFDFNVSRVNKLQASENVKNIFLFPHQFESLPDKSKASPLNVGYDSSRYYLTPNKNKNQVIRCCAARPSKGLFDFVKIAKLCPDFNFTVCVAEVAGDKTFVPSIKTFAKEQGSPAQVRANVPPDEMSELMRSSGIHLHTLDLPQSVGMCVSVAEGMACGNYSLTRNTIPLSQMIAGVGETFNTNEEAAKLINDTKSWDEIKWKSVSDATFSQSLKFADFNVFPDVIQTWNNLCK
jgi:hypothetical protein